MSVKKLTPDQIAEIKKLKQQMEARGEQFNYSQVGKMYGVSGPTIRRNIAPNEYDMKPRISSFKYDPEAAKEQRRKSRIVQMRLKKDTAPDSFIIEKLDSLDNMQEYLKGLVLADIFHDKFMGEVEMPGKVKSHIRRLRQHIKCRVAELLSGKAKR